MFSNSCNTLCKMVIIVLYKTMCKSLKRTNLFWGLSRVKLNPRKVHLVFVNSFTTWLELLEQLVT